MDRENLLQAARLLGEARLATAPTPDLIDRLCPQGQAEGYALQAALADWLTANGQATLAGYKVGATTADMQRYLGTPGPAFGHVRAANVHTSPAVLAFGGFHNPGIECEVAFRLGEDLDPAAPPRTRADLADRIEAVMPAIEIVENRYGDFLSRGIGTLIADDFFHKACVLGPPVMDWRDLDLATLRGRTVIDGGTAGEGRGADVMGHPLEAVLWLTDALARQGETLRAGQIVLTGSMTPVHWIAEFPCAAEIEIDELGACAVRLE